MKSRFKFHGIMVAKSEHAPQIVSALKKFKQERPRTFSVFADNVNKIVLAKPPIPHAVAWTDTEKTKVVFLSNREFAPNGTHNQNELVKTFAHETPHAALGPIPDSRQEEALAEHMETHPA